MERNLDYSLLAKLTQAFGPSGNEQRVAEIIMDNAKDHAESIVTDRMGNLIVRKDGQGQKIMIVCHMDEVGIIVTHINKNGFLYYASVGGLKGANLVSKRVRFSNGTVGIINKEQDETVEKKSERLYIDIGAANEQDAKNIVSVGDMAILTGEFLETENVIISKAIDDRVGCFIALEVIKNITSPYNLIFVFSAQEEVGARGAKTAAYATEADLAIVIDTTFSFDTPKVQNRTSLNNGVAIKVMDRSIVVSPALKNWMAKIAAANGIPYQWEIITSGGTDSGPIHLTKGGIPTGGLAIPVRYLHSGNEVVAKKDIIAGIDLLTALITTPLYFES